MNRVIATFSLMFVMVFVAFAAGVVAAPFSVYYDLDGAPKVPLVTWDGQSSAPGISALALSRGSGIEAYELTNGFSAAGWNMANPSLESALAVNAYFEFGLNVQSGYTASLSSLDLSLRRSALNGPMNYALYVSLDGFATPGVLVDTWLYRGRTSGSAPAADPLEHTPYYYMEYDLAGRPNKVDSPGDPIPTLDLSRVDVLQNVAGNTAVTFRLYAWGNDSTTATNTVALGRMVGPRIQGTVSAQ